MGMIFPIQNLMSLQSILTAPPKRGTGRISKTGSSSGASTTGSGTQIKVTDFFVENDAVKNIRKQFAARGNILQNLAHRPSQKLTFIEQANGTTFFQGEFVKVCEYVFNKYYKQNYSQLPDDVVKTIAIFFELIPHNKLLRYFLGHAFHGTGGFINLEADGTEKYKSRGCLQITEKQNYEKADKYCGTTFAENPEKLAILSEESVKASILCIFFIINNQYNSLDKINKMTHEQFMTEIKPREYDPAHLNDADSIEKRQNREKIEADLVQILPDNTAPITIRFLPFKITFWSNEILTDCPCMKNCLLLR